MFLFEWYMYKMVSFRSRVSIFYKNNFMFIKHAWKQNLFEDLLLVFIQVSSTALTVMVVSGGEDACAVCLLEPVCAWAEHGARQIAHLRLEGMYTCFLYNTLNIIKVFSEALYNT